MDNILKFAQAIRVLTFGELMEVSFLLVQMNQEGERDVKTTQGMAETLNDWADGHIEAAEEEDA